MSYRQPTSDDVATLDALRGLAADRCAAYERGEVLETYILLGRFIVDTAGNFGRADITLIDRSKTPRVGVSIAHALPPVVAMRTLQASLPGHIDEEFSPLSISWEGYLPPKSTDRCDACGHGWDVSNCHDAVELREPENWLHTACHRWRQQRRAVTELTKIAEEAGFGQAVLVPVPDQYWRNNSPYAGSWLEIRTAWGSIVFGWRKRVISIDWSDVVERSPREAKRLDGNVLFATFDGTKDRTLVHAYGSANAIQNLMTLREAITSVAPPAGEP